MYMLANKLLGTITTDKRLLVTLPDDARVGQVQVILLYDRPRPKRRVRRSSKQAHPAFRIWANRADISDAATFAAELRRRVESRTDGR
jgi:hypothetical protein